MIFFYRKITTTFIYILWGGGKWAAKRFIINRITILLKKVNVLKAHQKVSSIN